MPRILTEAGRKVLEERIDDLEEKKDAWLTVAKENITNGNIAIPCIMNAKENEVQRHLLTELLQLDKEGE